MKLKQIASNMTEIELEYNTKTGFNHVLFSYNTPVAAIDIVHNRAIKTNKYWSKTTTKHINKYLSPLYIHSITEVDQSVLDGLVNKVQL